MECRLLHLYPDLMNLYGEYGNIRVLERHLADQGFTVQLDKKSLGDEVDFSQYQFVYMGAGTERSQKTALNDLVRLQDGLKAYVEAGGVLLFTGNAFDTLGKSITAFDGTVFPGLSLADFTSIEHDERITGDAVAAMEDEETYLAGFINKCSEIAGVTAPLFHMEMGPGNSKNDSLEGWRCKNAFATHLIGPVLVKNPVFLTQIVKLIGASFPEFSYQPISYPHEEAASRITLDQLKRRMAQ